jgi:ribosomal protein L7Ae-like RNA K-turn-binding protein
MNNSFLQFLGLAKRAGKIIEGYNKCEELIKKVPIHLVVVSIDASDNTKDKFRGFSMRSSIPYIESYSSYELGNSIGRAEINILCVSDKKMADKLLELYDSQKNSRG